MPHAGDAPRRRQLSHLTRIRRHRSRRRARPLPSGCALLEAARSHARRTSTCPAHGARSQGNRRNAFPRRFQARRRADGNGRAGARPLHRRPGARARAVGQRRARPRVAPAGRRRVPRIRVQHRSRQPGMERLLRLGPLPRGHPRHAADRAGRSPGICLRRARPLRELALLLGHRGQAEDLRRRALGMRARILSRYWMEEAGFFAEALDGDKRHVDSISSNPGHLLWSGVLPRDKAKRVARVLLSEEMFSGYGVRTMGEAASEDGPLPRRLRAQARRREGGGGGLMSGLPIADFALLSDCRSAALVSRAGSLDGSAGRGSTRRPVSRGSSRIAPATGRSIRRARARRRGAVCTRRWSWKRPSRQPREAPSLPATDERMLATTHAIAERLTDRHGLVYRYRTHAGLPGEEHVPALHLLAGAGAGLAGELDRAKETFSRGGVRQRRGAPFRGSRSGDAAGALPLSTCARTGGDEARAGAETVAWNVSPPWPTRASTTHADARAGQDSVAILASAGLRFRARRACARRRDR